MTIYNSRPDPRSRNPEGQLQEGGERPPIQLGQYAYRSHFRSAAVPEPRRKAGSPGYDVPPLQATDALLDVDHALQAVVPLPIEQQQTQRQHPGAGHPVLIVRGEEIEEVQLVPEIGSEGLHALRIPLVPIGQVAAESGDDRQFDAPDEEEERRRQRRQAKSRETGGHAGHLWRQGARVNGPVAAADRGMAVFHSRRPSPTCHGFQARGRAASEKSVSSSVRLGL